MIINFRGRRIKVKAKKVSSLGKFTGLMFKPSKTENLLFEFSYSEFPSIHSVFVFFPFLAVWLDKNNKVVDFGIVKPFRLSIKPIFPSEKLIEIPINAGNSRAIKLFVGKRKDLNIW